MSDPIISTSSAASEHGESVPSGQAIEQLDLLSVPSTPAESSSDIGPMSKTTGMSEKSRQRRQGESTASVPPRPASHTLLPIEIEETNQMTVSSGRNCAELLKTSDPAGLLVRKLLTSPTWDSTLFSMRFVPLATPAKRLYFRLAVSERDTSDKDYGGFATPTGRDWKRTAWTTVPSHLWGEPSTRIFRVADGFSNWPHRPARIQAIGNSIVPQLGYEILKLTLKTNTQ